MFRRLAVTSVLCLLVVAAVAAASAPAISSQQAIDALNALRSENGIPGDVTLNQDWSQKCALHNHYMAVNNIMTHEEDSSKPAYTAGGAWCGSSAVLAGANGWSADTTPWDNAPIHLMQMLSPQLVESGAYVSEGYSSLTTWPGYEEVSANDQIYVYPGEGKVVQPSQLAAESPFTPQSFVGIPESQTTGPYLYLLADGPWTQSYGDPVTISAATLTGPSGPVAVKWVDQSTPTLGEYLPSGGIVIPVKPLQVGAHYSITVTLANGEDKLTKSWSFTTASAGSNGDGSSGGSLRANSGYLRVAGSSHKHLLLLAFSAAGHGSVTITFRGHLLRRFAERTHRLFSLPHGGSFRACLTSGGGSTGYRALRTCTGFHVS